MDEVSRQRRGMREQTRRIARERFLYDLRLPEGYRVRPGHIVLCSKCQRTWHVPDEMIEKLSDNAWTLLVHHMKDHAEVRKPARRPNPRVQGLLPRLGQSD
jgi:hypothetical protein